MFKRIVAPDPITVMMNTVASHFVSLFDEQSVKFDQPETHSYNTRIRVWTGRQVMKLYLTYLTGEGIHMRLTATKDMTAFHARYSWSAIRFKIPGPIPSVAATNVRFYARIESNGISGPVRGSLCIDSILVDRTTHFLKLLDHVVADEREYWDRMGLAPSPPPEAFLASPEDL